MQKHQGGNVGTSERRGEEKEKKWRSLVEVKKKKTEKRRNLKKWRSGSTRQRQDVPLFGALFFIGISSVTTRWTHKVDPQSASKAAQQSVKKRGKKGLEVKKTTRNGWSMAWRQMGGGWTSSSSCSLAPSGALMKGIKNNKKKSQAEKEPLGEEKAYLPKLFGVTSQAKSDVKKFQQVSVFSEEALN